MDNYYENICPVCNGLITLEESCPDCKETLEDNGHLENLLGPYAPYEENEETKNLDEKRGNCLHKVVCPYCERTWNIEVNKLDF